MKSFLKDIERHIPVDRIFTDEMRLLAWGTDAGFYRLIPQVVIQSANEKEIIEILKTANKFKLPVTFRGAGTSLSGQAISNSILVIAGKNWEKYEVAPDHNSIRLQPGIIGQRVNDILKPFGKKFPPDPASIKSAMVGGIIQNNASGMSCGTRQNSYKMLLNARIILADGTLLDTSSEVSRQEFRQTHPAFIRRICDLRDQVQKNAKLSELIRRKYSIKNVTGLSINPFVDFHDPFHIIANLIVGSEGTLAFLAEATMQTVEDFKYKASAMLYFGDTRTACETVIAIKNSPVTAVEFFDRKAIHSVEDKPNALKELKTLPETGSALLIKTEAEDEKTLKENIDKITAILTGFDTLYPTRFTDVESEYNAYWEMRSGIFPSVGSMRPVGTTCLIEDVAFQVEDLPQATEDLQQILALHKYDDAVIYGHALEGNYHFIINQRFDTQQAVAQYENMMNDVVKMVVDKYHGSLKAEHGTGRNMAPFVKREWGEEAFNLMREVKNLFDPMGLLNPGVIFNDDPTCHIKNFKPLPITHPLIDKCIECGFCEVNCISCGFTLSSRQRIVIQREIARLKGSGENPARLTTLVESFRYAGDESCAGDGLCSTSCPVGINVGYYIHVIREDNIRDNKRAQQIGAWSATHFSTLEKGLKTTLWAANATRSIIGNTAMGGFTKGLRYISGNRIPLWTPSLPKRGKRIRKQAVTDNPLKVVYFPSCLNQMMGTSPKDPDQTPLVQKTIEFLNKAGYEVIFPKSMDNLCCGTIWESKGMPEIADQKSSELEKELYLASGNGEYPVLCDQSPCLKRMRHTMSSLKLYEPVEFIDQFLLDKLDFKPTDESITVHATCSTIHMGLKPTLVKIAKLCSTNVLVPEEVGCCGFAGDKGFTLPELNEYGLRKLRTQVESAHAKTGYCNSRTCEIGLNTHGGIPYMSIVYLVDKCTEKKG
ncbi:MAG: FAD-binding and (Fe-S)-binding domain-containing protein [Paludibacter sp.]|nr:FAD-binding and (Fe-S)-binding domain-containing protein [Paludibacter sp.]